MRFSTLVLILFVIVSSFLLPHLAKADHCAGGEIAYQWLADSTYRIYFKFYRDCLGIPESPTVNMCYSNSCSTQGGILQLSKVVGNLPDGRANGSEVYTGCPGFSSRCVTTTATIPGIREWWYTNTITLPSRCNFWKFAMSISQRNTAQNIVGGGFAVEATLNNIAAQGNSSPFFSVKPIPYVCINQPYSYNNGAVDPDSDSLAFEVIQPSTNSNCPANLQPINFKSGAPSYNINNNPFQTNNTFVINNTTGQLNFTPALLGGQSVSVRVKEYRNGVLIGTTMRDIQIQVLVCNSPVITMDIANTTIIGATYTNNRIEGCAGAPLSFCFNIKSATSTSILLANDNHNFATPGSSLIYQNQAHDSVRGCFSWTPGPLDTGTRILTVTAKDSSCVSPGIAISQTFLIPLYINRATQILKDTGVCLGDSVQLTAVGGSSFAWTVLPGGSPSSSLSCLSCKAPFVKPTATTRYVVTSNLTSVCLKNKDTVTVMVTTTPPAKPSASSNSPICLGDTLRLYGSTTTPGVSFLWSGADWFKSILQNPKKDVTQLLDAGYYTLRAVLNGCASIADSITVVINTVPAPPVTAIVDYCLGDVAIPLTAVGSNLKWYTSFSGGTPLVGGAPTPSTAITGIFRWYVSQSNVCGESALAPASVKVSLKSPMPVGKDVIYCKNEATLPLTATGINLKWYTTPSAGAPLPSTPVPSSAVPGVYTWYVSQFVNCAESNRDTVTVTIKQPPAPVAADVSYCQGTQALPLTAVGLKLLWYNSASGGTGDTLAPTPSTVATGTYYFYVSQSVNDCESERTAIKVVVTPPPIVQLKTSKNEICIYDSVMVENLVQSPSGVDYYWKPDKGYFLDSGKQYIVTQWSSSGKKTVVLELKDGVCIVRDSLFVLVQDPPFVSFEISQSACQGQVVTLYPSLQDAWYYWSIDGQTITDTAYAKSYQLIWTEPGNHIIRLGMTGKNGCVAVAYEKTISIHENPAGKIESISRINVCKGDSVYLTATPNVYYSYEWSPQGFFLNANAAYVTAIVDGDATVKLTISNEWGCTVTDKADVSTEKCCDIIFPDAFTPNDDGHNDKFGNVSSAGKYSIHTFIVVNRWGKVLFESQEVGKGWDGLFNGEPQDMGTYFYYIKYVCEGKSLDEKGSFILLR